MGKIMILFANGISLFMIF